MEFIDGNTLHDYLLDDSLHMLYSCVRFIKEEVFGRGLSHGNLHSDNIIFSNNHDRWYLLDAEFMEEDNEDEQACDLYNLCDIVEDKMNITYPEQDCLHKCYDFLLKTIMNGVS